MLREEVMNFLCRICHSHLAEGRCLRHQQYAGDIWNHIAFRKPLERKANTNGIYKYKLLTNISTLDEVKINRKCDCSNVKLKAYSWSSGI